MDIEIEWKYKLCFSKMAIMSGPLLKPMMHYGNWHTDTVKCLSITMFNTLRPGQNWSYFAHDTFKCIFFNTLRPRQNGRHFQMTFSNAISWMKIDEFRLRFHWSLFQRFQLTIFQHWFGQWLGAVQVTSHYLNQWWLIYRRIYVSLGLNELMKMFEFRLIFHLSLFLRLQLTIFHYGFR